MNSDHKKTFCNRPGIDRRRFLQFSAGLLTLLTTGISPASATPYRIGVGKSTDPYDATLRAINASGDWTSLQLEGKTVIIKPNLVYGIPADSGITTEPEVVRAMVDLSLDAGAAEVVIVENGPDGANFTACGYDVFISYDPRVRLVDLNDEPSVAVRVPDGLSYFIMHVPEMLLYNDVVFMSASKLKTHVDTHASLCMKNLVGLVPYEKYRVSSGKWAYALHLRGINQVIVDLNLIRPIDFAVVDGIWGMEGDGPRRGVPVKTDMVVAGKNALAVDRVCLEATAIPQEGVKHLTYAARKNMGPQGIDEIDILGDPFEQIPFQWPSELTPLIEYPKAFPQVFSPATGQETRIFYQIFPRPCWRRVYIVRSSEFSSEETRIRTVQDWRRLSAGLKMITWDGRDDNGFMVQPGTYSVRVEAKYTLEDRSAFASGSVIVI
jgi:uncharacterized protein (DUF362 family)